MVANSVVDLISEACLWLRTAILLNVYVVSTPPMHSRLTAYTVESCNVSWTIMLLVT
jgi:hypothetical protein